MTEITPLLPETFEESDELSKEQIEQRFKEIIAAIDMEFSHLPIETQEEITTSRSGGKRLGQGDSENQFGDRWG